MAPKNDPNRVMVFDTTLRDGEQSPGCSMNLGEKMEMARALADLGVDVIEAGFPIASPGDFESVRAIAREVHGPIICGLARCNPADIDRAASVAIPHGRWGIAHCGVMVPNLPEPFRFFDAIVILGTARAPIFGKRSLATGDPDDSAWILTGSAATPSSSSPTPAW